MILHEPLKDDVQGKDDFPRNGPPAHHISPSSYSYQLLLSIMLQHHPWTQNASCRCIFFWICWICSVNINHAYYCSLCWILTCHKSSVSMAHKLFCHLQHHNSTGDLASAIIYKADYSISTHKLFVLLMMCVGLSICVAALYARMDAAEKHFGFNLFTITCTSGSQNQ